MVLVNLFSLLNLYIIIVQYLPVAFTLTFIVSILKTHILL